MIGSWLRKWVSGAGQGTIEPSMAPGPARSTAPPEAEADPQVEAERLFRQAQSFEQSGHREAALLAYRQAEVLLPNGAGIRLAKGNVLFDLGRGAEALTEFRDAIRLRPELAGAHFSLGRALMLLGRGDEAVEPLERAVALAPDFQAAWLGLAAVRESRQRWVDAAAAFQEVLRAEPDHRDALMGRSRTLSRAGRLDDAFDAVSQVLERSPEDGEAQRFAAKLCLDLGLQEQAVAHLEKAAQLMPGRSDVQSMHLFALNYLADVTAESLAAAHAAFGRRYQPLTGSEGAPSARRAPGTVRPLRVGYISGDFRRHVVSRFFEPVLQHHDRARMQCVLFHNHAGRDEVTDRLQRLAHEWHEIAALGDDALDRLIRSRGLDLLIDLSGHTEGHRLDVLARKPAPVQASWLGYLHATGVPAMDFRICDRHVEPSAEPLPGLEPPAWLPNCQWCLPLDEALPDVSVSPASSRGYTTFGSFNNLAKITPQVLGLWARILAGVPQSRLLMVGIPEGRSAERIRAAFAIHGVDPARIELRPRVERSAYFESYGEVDIVLDAFPYNGGTTSLDALMMGVPFVALEGRTPAGRGGASLLRNIGLDEWVARTEDEYVTIASSNGARPAALAELRREMRTRLAGSPLTDIATFVRDVERLYQRMAGWAVS